MAVFLAVQRCPLIASSSLDKVSKPTNANVASHHSSRFHSSLCSPENLPNRRHVLACGSSFIAIVAFNCSFTPLPLLAEDEPNGEEDKEIGVVGAIKSIFDPNEKTKTGKVLPKAYLKSAREVVQTLRESLKEDPVDMPKFRRTADAAKESIREYLSNWQGRQIVVSEESYVVLEKAIRSLASFYSSAGPSAALPENVKAEILHDLDTAEEFL